MKKPWRLAAYALGGAFAVWLTARLLLPVGLPFLLGMGLARLAEPLIRRMEKLPRWFASFLSVSVVVLMLGLFLWLLGRVLFGELRHFAARLPDMLESLAGPVEDLHQSLLRLVAKLPDGMASAASQWLDRLFAGGSVVADSLSGWLLSLLTGTLASLPDLVLFLLTVLLSSYMLASEWPQLCALAKKWLPDAWRDRFLAVWNRLKSALGGYFRAQLRLLLVTFGIVSVGLLVLGRKHAVLFALLVAVVDALPVFGSGTVLIPWAVLSYLRGETGVALGLLITYAAASLSRTMLEPRFLGRQMGLHPLLTLLSLYAGYRLFGIVGMILLPVAAILFRQLLELLEPPGESSEA